MEPIALTEILYPESSRNILKKLGYDPTIYWLDMETFNYREPAFYLEKRGSVILNPGAFVEDQNPTAVSTHFSEHCQAFKRLFAEIRSAGLPVRVRLDCRENGAFFAPLWQRPESSNKSMGEWLKDDSRSEAKTITYSLPKAYHKVEDYYRPAFQWGLPKVCSEITELQIIYGHSFAQTWEIFKYIDEVSDSSNGKVSCHKKVETYARRQVQKRLIEESKQLALLFRSLQHYTELRKLILYMPAALYPDHDQTLINCCLPGHNWHVQQYGSGGELLSPVARGPVPSIQRISEYFCPFIHRVFSRAGPASICVGGRKIANNNSWNVTVRPRVDLKPVAPDMETLLTCEPDEYFHMGWDY